jgi:hypothetical protein
MQKPISNKSTESVEEKMDDPIERLSGWPQALEKINTDQADEYFAPLAEGKWSKAAMIAHILFWDQFFLEERLPFMVKGTALSRLSSDDVEEINQKAWDYADSGIALKQLIGEAISQRERLIHYLEDKDLSTTFTIGGKVLSLEEYTRSEAEHDEHHIRQLGPPANVKSEE